MFYTFYDGRVMFLVTEEEVAEAIRIHGEPWKVVSEDEVWD